MNFSYLKYCLLFFSVILSESNKCDCDFNSCNSFIFKNMINRDVSRTEFNDWQRQYSDQLVDFFESYSDTDYNKDELKSQAKRNLASQIGEVIINDLSRETSENNGDKKRILRDKVHQFLKVELKNHKTITVKEGDKKYSIHMYKCRYESCLERCDLSMKLIDLYDNNIRYKIESMTDDVYGEKLNELFEYLVEMYIYIHSFPYPKNSGTDQEKRLMDIESEVSKYLSDNIINYMKKYLNISQGEITLSPYIYFNTDISLIFEDEENTNYIDGFKLIAEHKNGKSSWLNNKEQINSFSNSETSFSPGMILSTTSEQYIDIYPDFQSIIDQIEAEKENSGIYVITDNAKKALELFITSNPIASIKINSKEELYVKLKFQNLNSNLINILKKAINSYKDINICESEDNNCFELLFDGSKDYNNSIIVNLITPDKNKRVESELFIKNNKVSNLKSVFKELNRKISFSKLSYNFCDQIDLYVNGNQLKKTNKNYAVTGNTNIKLKYDNKMVLDTNIVIYQDKDLIDLEELDIFTDSGEGLCYNQKHIEYKVFIENSGDHSDALVYWNGKKQNYNNMSIKFKENSLRENLLKIKKNGYQNYSNKIYSNLNYRGQYPVNISLKPIENIFGNPMFKGFNMSYLSNLIIPGKGQIQFYKTSNFNKFKSLIIGLGAYYFAGQSLDSYNEYINYRDKYNNYLNLYNNSTDPDLINQYRNNLENNRQLMKNEKNKASNASLISGIFLLLNAIEITLIHISVDF